MADPYPALCPCDGTETAYRLQVLRDSVVANNILASACFADWWLPQFGQTWQYEPGNGPDVNPPPEDPPPGEDTPPGQDPNPTTDPQP
jgi:hypothetical protein